MSKAAYLDASALVKRYVKESGSGRVDSLFGSRGSVLCTASLTYAEIYATLHRLRRESLLRAGDLTHLLEAFEADWRALAVIEFNADVRGEVPAQVAAVGLRGADLVHLTSALAFRRIVPTMTFICADKRLRHAAADAGLEAVDPAQG